MSDDTCPMALPTHTHIPHPPPAHACYVNTDLHTIMSSKIIIFSGFLKE